MSASAAPLVWHRVADAGAIPLREGRRVRFQDHDVALFNLGDRFLAVDNRCSHRQGPLADGIVAGAAVYCPLHTWKISLETGCVLAGGEGKIRAYPVRLEGGNVYVAFDAMISPPNGSSERTACVPSM